MSKSNSSVDNKYIHLSDIDHARQCAEMYIGNVRNNTKEIWILKKKAQERFSSLRRNFLLRQLPGR